MVDIVGIIFISTIFLFCHVIVYRVIPKTLMPREVCLVATYYNALNFKSFLFWQKEKFENDWTATQKERERPIILLC